MEKELVINGKVFAKYELEENHIFIKVIIEIFPGNKGLSEDWLVKIISTVEDNELNMVSYLNID